MTGYGRSVGVYGDFLITLDLRSVNHKSSEISVKLPRALFPLERELKQMLRGVFFRGRVDLVVTLAGGEKNQKEVFLDKNLARQYHRQLLELKKILKIPGSPDVFSLLSLKDVLVVNEIPLDPQRFKKPLQKILRKSIGLVDEMRKKEGKAMEAQIRRGLKNLTQRLSKIMIRVPKVVLDHKNRLAKKIHQISGGISMDQNRLLQEVAYFAERSDVEEEITRFKSHCSQFEFFLKSRNPKGRSLDFLVQEMHREANTLGAKANDTLISQEVIGIKGELERLREQCQNIE